MPGLNPVSLTTRFVKQGIPDGGTRNITREPVVIILRVMPYGPVPPTGSPDLSHIAGRKKRCLYGMC